MTNFYRYQQATNVDYPEELHNIELNYEPLENNKYRYNLKHSSFDTSLYNQYHNTVYLTFSINQLEPKPTIQEVTQPLNLFLKQLHTSKLKHFTYQTDLTDYLLDIVDTNQSYITYTLEPFQITEITVLPFDKDDIYKIPNYNQNISHETFPYTNLITLKFPQDLFPVRKD